MLKTRKDQRFSDSKRLRARPPSTSNRVDGCDFPHPSSCPRRKEKRLAPCIGIYRLRHYRTNRSCCCCCRARDLGDVWPQVLTILVKTNQKERLREHRAGPSPPPHLPGDKHNETYFYGGGGRNLEKNGCHTFSKHCPQIGILFFSINSFQVP